MRHLIESSDEVSVDVPSESAVLHAIPMRLDHHFPDSLATRYASEVSVQVTRGGCFISFFDVIPPVLTGTPEENRTRLEQMQSIRAECVARVFVPAYKLAEIVNLFQNAASQSASLPSEPASSSESGGTGQ